MKSRERKVVKKHVNYRSFVKVGSEGPRHEWLDRSDFKKFRGFESSQKGYKIHHFRDFPDKRAVGRKKFEQNRESEKVVKKHVIYSVSSRLGRRKV